MLAVFEMIGALVSALMIGVLAQFGIDATPKPPPSRAEKVVVRTPAKRPVAAPTGHSGKAAECPHASASRSDLV